MSSLDELYEKLGVRKGISAAGTATIYGGSKLRPEVTQIMIEASTVMLDMDELNIAAGKMIGELTENGEGSTEIKGNSTITIQGMLAQFGSRMVEDVSNQIFIQFTGALAARLEGQGEPQSTGEALSGISVASAAFKGVSGRFMDKFKPEKEKNPGT